MPAIQQRVLDSVIYLYPTADDARNGTAVGGTGFLIGVRLEGHPDHAAAYAVTNAHVISDGFPVMRVNTTDGGIDVMAPPAWRWMLHPQDHDLAICPVGLHERHKFFALDNNDVITRQDLIDYAIAPGDDCFMVGRFIEQDGKQINRPAVRFGNLAMLNGLIGYKDRTEKERSQDSFLIDMRSLSGFSGSPVVVYWASVGRRQLPNQDIDGGEGQTSAVVTRGWILGVEWSNIPVRLDLLDENGKRLPGKLKASVNSGMSAVVPGWYLTELLDSEAMVKQREELDRQLTENTPQPEVGSPELTSMGSGADDEGASSTIQFLSDLEKASRQIKVRPKKTAEGH